MSVEFLIKGWLLSILFIFIVLIFDKKPYLENTNDLVVSLFYLISVSVVQGSIVSAIVVSFLFVFGFYS